MSVLKEKLEKINVRLAELSIRERILGTMGMLAVLYCLGEVLLFAPLEKQRQDLRIQSDNVFSQIMVYQTDFNSLVAESLQDPTLAVKKKVEFLRQKEHQIDRQLEKLKKGLTVEQEPVLLLQELLRENSGLKVIEVKKGEAVPFKFSGDESRPETAFLVSESIEIELEGSYLTFFDYLKSIEQSSLKLFWDDLKLEVLNHPINRITLKIHTLSPAKETPDV